ncbi:TIGR00730 family Rossman fold protein [Polymorphobacter sp. PAMC 29334]|uniref:LOG family protein n=1 Tax=Polymorphobacter sp. PAMC 29334 TaxID=2862331 RepID=UPI001C7477A4|nr:TIGR00730 family Rossman fold protein [Polymorphobacter sp. PAMC 29334]QYE34282.1 TIGR00730 family Rossman fold protein [Polymorphobacter sp. PAMC 29334]
MTIGSLCLFCGSMPGVDPAAAELAAGFGAFCAERGLTLVYGGGTFGLMGIAARAALAGGTEVIGIIPAALEAREVAQPGLSELIVTATLHERKALMFAKSDAIVVLPGGIGTMDELFEVMTWRNLGLHTKPIFLLGGRFWQPFLGLLGHLDRAGFAYPGLFALVETVDLVGLAAFVDR